MMWFLLYILDEIRSRIEDAHWFLTGWIVNEPQPLCKDSVRGITIRWKIIALTRAMLCPLAFWSPLRYLKEVHRRKMWWDNLTDGQRHWYLEEQNRLVESLLDTSDKLLKSLSETNGE